MIFEVEIEVEVDDISEGEETVHRAPPAVRFWTLSSAVYVYKKSKVESICVKEKERTSVVCLRSAFEDLATAKWVSPPIFTRKICCLLLTLALLFLFPASPGPSSPTYNSNQSVLFILTTILLLSFLTAPLRHPSNATTLTHLTAEDMCDPFVVSL